MPENALHDDPAAIWERVAQELRSSLPASTFDLWLGAVKPVRTQEATLYLACPATARAWVERRYTGAVEEALRRQPCGLDRVVWVDEEGGSGTRSLVQPAGTVEPLPLDSTHTFERFVIGSGNRLAHAAALAVAELPGEAYNPLFLHGPPGLGKTHLLGAIADYLRRRRPELTTHYTTAERFTSDFVGALRKDGPERFKRRYRELDALLIDDVQALEGKERTQEEFVHTFNALHAVGKQIVLSSDRPPETIPRLADRVRDRFAWGLCVELGPPDLRTKTAVLWQITEQAPLQLDEPTVLSQIARLATGNVRRLEGAMTRVAALSSVLNEPVTPTLVRRALEGARAEAADSSISGARLDTPSVAAIQDTVCSVLGVTRDDLLSQKRTARVARARQLAMYLARELTSLSLAQIARQFQRDHSTVLYAIRSVSSQLDPDSETARALHRSREMLLPRISSSSPFSHSPTNNPQVPSTE